MSSSSEDRYRVKLTRRALFRMTGGAAAFAALAAACQPTTTAPAASSVASAPAPSGATTAPKAGGTAVISLGEPDTLGFGSRSLTFAYIRSFIANGLVRLKYPDMTVVEDLAAFTASSDNKTYTFNLKKGVKWHDGDAFTSNDVKSTLELYAHPANPAPLSDDFANIDGAKAFKTKTATEVTGIKASPDQVVITLVAPSPSFLTSVATTTILPAHILKDVAPPDLSKHAFARKPVYTGPFKVDEWKSGESITYSAFPDHFKGRPNLDKVVQRIFPDPSTALAELRTGGIQQGFVNADQFDEFASDQQKWATQQLAGSTGWFLSFDMTNKDLPFGEKTFRQAVSYAIDRNALIQALFKGRAEKSYSLSSPLSWVHNASVTKYDYDPAKAKQLLDDLGWKPGTDGIRVKDGKRLEYATMVTSTSKDWFLAIQPMLKAVGIGSSKVDTVDFGTWISRLNVGKYESTVNGWGNFAIDPRADLAAHFRSPRFGDATGYKNDQVDQLFSQASKAASRDEEKKLYDQLQMIAEGDAVYVYLFRPQLLDVNLKNLALPQAKIQAEIYDGLPRWELR
jgi:peptide/nickel transport system substrate-binding protein